MERETTYWEEIRHIWGDEIKSWFGWGDWKQTVTSIVVALVGPLIAFYGGSVDIAIDDIFVKIVAAISGLIWFVIIAIGTYIHANEVLYEEKKIVLSKHNWSLVRFDEVPYHIVGVSGYALRITNDKIFDLDRIQVRWITRRVNQDIFSFREVKKAYYFPIIDYENQNMGFYDEDKSIKHGKSKDFAITGLENPSTVYKFMTVPKENGVEWPFQENQITPEVVIEVEIISHMELDNEKTVLPIKTISIHIMPDGNISIDGKEKNMKDKQPKKKQQKTSSEEEVFTKEDFLKSLNKVIAKKIEKSPAKEKSGTSE